MEVAIVLSRWPIRNKLLLGIALLVVILSTISTSSFQGTYSYRGLVRSLSMPRHRVASGDQAFPTHRRFTGDAG